MGNTVYGKFETMNQFFITGLPRSRTAWMANFITYGNTHCFHDVFIECPRVSGLARLFRRCNTENVGVSDPALLMFYRAVMQLFPKARWLVIERSVADVIESSRIAFGRDVEDGIIRMAKEAESLKRCKNVRVVQFDAIDDDPIGLAQYLAVNFQSPPERNRLLSTLNVQVDAKVLNQELKASFDKGGLVWA